MSNFTKSYRLYTQDLERILLIEGIQQSLIWQYQLMRLLGMTQ